MKYVKLFEDFSSQETLTEDQIKWLDKCAKRGWNLNPSTGLIDVDGDFNCVQQNLTDFKGVAFGHIKKSFYCNNNLLTSLEGAPQTVNGSFYCGNNRLTSLKEAPQTVGGDFYCHDNQLTSLVGATQTVNGNFLCHNNELTSLVGAPQTFGGDFLCHNNQLTSLEGAPQTVRMNFVCHNNPVSEETLSSIFSLMKKGKSYQQALEEHWPKMDDADRILMYKDYRSLTPEEIRRYDALTTVSRIKNYL
jgi:hypothetical protein